MPWRPTGVAAELLAAGSLREVNLNGRSVVLVRLGVTVHAVDGLCPHQGGILGEGQVQGQRMVCPEHGAEFEIETGEVRVDPHGVEPPCGGASPLTVYPTRETAGMIEVDIE